MSKIGILGGSFDPIHKGHIKIMEEAIMQLSLDRFFVIPTGTNPWKETAYASVNDRIKMIDLAIEKIDKVEINEIELQQAGKNYTIDTIHELIKQYPHDTFYYIMGMDQASKFHLWKNAKEISELVQVIVFDRVGYTSNENISNYHFKQLQIEPMDISSSDIRLGNYKSLDTKVWKYIVHKGLYLDTIIQSKMTTKRYLHTISMANLARDIAKENGVDQTKAYVAGMLHDIAKEMDESNATKIMQEHYAAYLDKPYPVWHQWLSEYIAKTEYLVEDIEILQAIRHHTTASIQMSTLDMCIYVADKYDPNRAYDSSKEIALCKEDILEGFKQCLKDFYDFSKKENREIDRCFFEVYKTYIKGEL